MFVRSVFPRTDVGGQSNRFGSSELSFTLCASAHVQSETLPMIAAEAETAEMMSIGLNRQTRHMNSGQILEVIVHRRVGRQVVEKLVNLV